MDKEAGALDSGCKAAQLRQWWGGVLTSGLRAISVLLLFLLFSCSSLAAGQYKGVGGEEKGKKSWQELSEHRLPPPVSVHFQRERHSGPSWPHDFSLSVAEICQENMPLLCRVPARGQCLANTPNK